ncbi:hypothetical protein BB559_003796 [Furculomyces boomerangus]|uniref:threonine--tRNA ligase n=2 Tax=Harpellales TaxID=61421 RepID=A0A2T9YIQ7_9FUNG|nr:hypothetical protein BB559_003796 [Furculomyces boomerangus]PWA00124.1 hypothetical protein BB558_003834 [Smittium angustum]
MLSNLLISNKKLFHNHLKFSVVSRSLGILKESPLSKDKIWELAKKTLGDQKNDSGNITVTSGKQKFDIKSNTLTPMQIYEQLNLGKDPSELSNSKGENIIVPLISNTVCDMNTPLKTSGELRFLNSTEKSEKLLINDILWRSSGVVLSASIEKLFGEYAFLFDSKVLSPRDPETSEYIGGGFSSDFALFDKSYLKEIENILIRENSNKPSISGNIINKIKSIYELSPKIFEFLNKEKAKKVWDEYTKIVLRNEYIDVIEVPAQLAIEIMQSNPFAQSAIASKLSNINNMVLLYKLQDHIGTINGPIFQQTNHLANKIELEISSSHFVLPDLVQENGSIKPNSDEKIAFSKEPSLNRVTGITFYNKNEMKNYNEQVEIASKNDHRIIGKEQSLYMMHKYSPGSPFFLKYGTRIINRILELLRDKYKEHGFDEVITPQIYYKALWETSGHWENYKDDMFAIIEASEIDKKESSQDYHGCCSGIHTSAGEKGGLKPMNCPGHCLIFASNVRSYRDLPLRLADLSPLHRNEPVGTLSGLTRVRRFHQDDGHIFCSKDSIQEEIYKQLLMIDQVYKIFGFKDYQFTLSTRPELGFIGSIEQWDSAESMLKSALDKSNRHWSEKHGDGAFYGPKIDVYVKDSFGRKHQTATVQLDFQLPKRFNLKFINKEGKKEEPVIIHRAVLGSIERMLAILSEHYSGKWPFWVSPRQALVVPVLSSTTSNSDSTNPQEVESLNNRIIEYANMIHSSLQGGNFHKNITSNIENDHFEKYINKRIKAYKFHVDIETAGSVSQKLGRVVKAARLNRYNYLIVVGANEMNSGLVNVRAFNGKEIGSISLPKLQETFMDMMDNYD